MYYILQERKAGNGRKEWAIYKPGTMQQNKCMILNVVDIFLVQMYLDVLHLGEKSWTGKMEWSIYKPGTMQQFVPPVTRMN